jgi:hypothetical protein
MGEYYKGNYIHKNGARLKNTDYSDITDLIRFIQVIRVLQASSDPFHLPSSRLTSHAKRVIPSKQRRTHQPSLITLNESR